MVTTQQEKEQIIDTQQSGDSLEKYAEEKGNPERLHTQDPSRNICEITKLQT